MLFVRRHTDAALDPGLNQLFKQFDIDLDQIDGKHQKPVSGHLLEAGQDRGHGAGIGGLID